MKHIIIVTHGIETKKSEFLGPDGWGTAFRNYLERPDNGEDRRVVLVYWGNLRFFFARKFTGIVGRFVRNAAIKKIQKVANEEMQKFPGAKISIVGHSLGTFVAYKSMYYETKFPRPIFDKVVLLASVVSRRENFERTAGHFSELLCGFSSEDEMCRFNPYGHSGYKGFITSGIFKDTRKVVNQRFEYKIVDIDDGIVKIVGYEHTDYIYSKRDDVLDVVSKFLGGKYVKPNHKSGR